MFTEQASCRSKFHGKLRGEDQADNLGHVRRSTGPAAAAPTVSGVPDAAVEASAAACGGCPWCLSSPPAR